MGEINQSNFDLRDELLSDLTLSGILKHYS
jgi:hypothetical protein